MVLSKRNRYQGLNVYARRLLQEFRKLHTSANSIIVPFVARGLEDEANELVTGNGFRPASSSLLRLRHVWRCGGSSWAAFAVKADLLFSPTALVLPLGLVPVVATIADATPLRLPSELFFRASLEVQRVLSRSAARLSRKIITLSEHSKEDIVELYRVPPEKVSVIYCGYNDQTFNSKPQDKEALKQLLSRFGIRGPYFFHHGTIQPRKNFQRLIEAYGQVMEKNRNLDMQLVLAGSFGWQHEPIVQAGAKLQGRSKVIFTGPLVEEELALLLKGSFASVVPSLYEGFCLPMVESMACGIPTIAANASCLPEISGGGLCYFDPLSVDDMANSMQNLLEDGDLRNRLACYGLHRASSFSWERCGRETLDLLVRTHEESLS